MTAQPTINSITDGGDMASAIANVSGSGTVQLYYRKRGASAWLTGVTKAGLANYLAAHYKMNEISGTVITDSSGNGHHGTSVRDASLMHVDGIGGGALEFNGISDYINTNQTFQTTFRQSYTISGRVTPLTAYPPLDEERSIWGKDPDNGYGEVVLGQRYTDGRVSFFLFTESGQIVVETVEEVFLGSILPVMITVVVTQIDMTHLTVTIFKDDINLSTTVTFREQPVDGSIIEARIDNFTSPLDFVIAASSSNAGIGSFFDGYLDNFMIFNRALSAEEIAELYNDGDGTESLDFTSDITQTGLEPGWYDFYATDTVDGVESAPSGILTVNIAGETSSFEAAIRSILSQDLTVAAIVSSRIFPNQIPQGEPMPAAAYKQLTGELDYENDGQDGLKHPRFEITAWSESYAQTKSLSAAIISALSGYSGTVDNITIRAIFLMDEKDDYRQKDGSEITARHGRVMIFEIWHKE